jgi:hypothetical protein
VGSRYSTRSQEAPATTTKKSKTELIKDSQSSINDKESARKWLLKHELIIPGEESSGASPSLALLYLANGKYEMKATIDGIRAIAIFFDGNNQSNNPELNSTRNIIQDIETSLETITNKYYKSLDSTLKALTINHRHTETNIMNNTPHTNPPTSTPPTEDARQFSKEEAAEYLKKSNLITQEGTTSNTILTQTLIQISTQYDIQPEARNSIQAVATLLQETQIDAMASNISNHVIKNLRSITVAPPETPPTHGPTEITTTHQTTTRPSYASMLAKPTPHPELADVMARNLTSAKQILITFDETNTSTSPASPLTEKDLVTKANMAVELLKDSDNIRPNPFIFNAAKKLRNGNVLYTLTTTEAASWLRIPENQKTFSSSFGGTANIKNRLYHLIAEFVPTTFIPDSTFSHLSLETANNLEANVITWSKYVKPIHLRATNQREAHLLLGINNKENANHIIRNGLYIEGKHVLTRKTTPEPRRCVKCQQYGHYVADCKSDIDTCAKCADSHRTSTCKVTKTTARCINCKNTTDHNHYATDKDCPLFLAEIDKLQKRNPEHKYKFFPTEDPTTWELLTNFDQHYLQQQSTNQTHYPTTTAPTAPPHQNTLASTRYKDLPYRPTRMDHYSPKNSTSDINRRGPSHGNSYRPLEDWREARYNKKKDKRPTINTLEIQQNSSNNTNDPIINRRTTNLTQPSIATHFSNTMTNMAPATTLSNQTPGLNHISWADQIPNNPEDNLPPLPTLDSWSPPTLEYV